MVQSLEAPETNKTGAEAAPSSGPLSGAAPSGGVGPADPGKTRASRPMSLVMQAYLLILTLLLLYLLLVFWPQGAPSGAAAAPERFFFGLIEIALSEQARLMTLVLISGALGGLIHAFRSLSAFAGQRRLVTSWTFWYVARPFSAAILALLFYLLISGGFLPDPNAGGDLSVAVPAISGLAALIGLFSEQAINKLKDVMQVLLTTNQPERLGDQLSHQGGGPLLEALEPSRVPAGRATVITLRGSNFTDRTVVRVGGSARQATFVDDRHLTLALAAEDLTAVTSLPVQTVAADGATSAELTLWVSLASPDAAAVAAVRQATG